MELVFCISFLFLAVSIVHGTEYPWSRSSVQNNKYRRLDTPSADLNIIPYNDRLDAREWLDRLLGSLTSEQPTFNGVQSTPTQTPQRIFQREARPSLTFVQNHPTGKRRFSLASVRVNPISLKRQHIFAAPNMALLQLESPARFPSRVNTQHVRPVNTARPVQQRQQRPRGTPLQQLPTFRQHPVQQTYQEEEDEYPGHLEFSFENPAGSGSSLSERHLEVDVHVNHYD